MHLTQFSPFVQGGYQIEGLDEDFGSLQELIDYYHSVPVSADGMSCATLPVLVSQYVCLTNRIGASWQCA